MMLCEDDVDDVVDVFVCVMFWFDGLGMCLCEMVSVVMEKFDVMDD